MKNTVASLLFAILSLGATLGAAETLGPKVDEKAWLEKARHSYPLKTCIVSGETLGEMGAPYEYIYKEAGKPDQLVLFCCKSCLKDFHKAPAKYLSKLEKASDNSAAKAHH